MKPGTRIVSNTFTMEDWQPDTSETIGGDCTSWCTAHLWIVPAKVAGHVAGWAQNALTLTQKFQMLDGTLGSTAITDGRAARRRDHLHRRQHQVHRPGERQLDLGHDERRQQRILVGDEEVAARSAGADVPGWLHLLVSALLLVATPRAAGTSAR